MSKGGNGGGGKTEFVWNDEIKPYWQRLLSSAQDNAADPYESYFNATGRPRTADINSDQNEAMNYTRNMARMSTSPIGAMDGAREGITDTLGGDYLTQNPAAQAEFNPWTDQFRNNYLTTANPWTDQYRNQYAAGPGAIANPWTEQYRNDWGSFANKYNDQSNPWANQSAQTWGNQFMGGAYQNPYSDEANEFTGLGGNANPYSGQQINSGGMFSAAPTQAGTNAFQGMDNPYFRQTMQQGMQDIGDVYKNSTDPETRANFVLNGTLGGGAYQQAVDRNQSNLAKQLTNYATGMQNAQYERSAGLDESRLGRAFQGQQFDANLGAQSFENAAQRSMDAQKFGVGMGSQNYESALNRAFQGQEAQYGRGYGSNESDIARRFAGEESAIGRSLQNQQFDKQLGGNWYDSSAARWNQNYENQLNRGSANTESMLNRGADAFQADMNRSFQGMESALTRGNESYQNALNRGFQSDESALTRGNDSWQQAQDREAQLWDAERNRMMQGIGLGQNEQGLAYQRIGGMMGIGDFQRGVTQQQNDESYQNWFDQQNWGKNQNAWLAGILSGAQGGLPPSQMTSGAGNNYANTLGAALAAYGMFRS